MHTWYFYQCLVFQIGIILIGIIPKGIKCFIINQET